MRKFSFIPHTKIRLDGIAYELIDPFELEGVAYWRIKVRASGVYEQRPTTELERLYDKGSLIGELGAESLARSTFPNSRSRLTTSELPETTKARIAFRKAIIKGVANQTTRGCKVVLVPEASGETLLERVLRELGRSCGMEIYGKPKNVSVASYYRWVQKYREYDDDRDLGGAYPTKRAKGPFEIVRKIAHNCIARLLEDAQQRPIGSKPRYTMRDVMHAVLDGIEEERKKSPHLHIPMPKRPTLYAYHRAFPAALRELAAHGPIKAKAMARTPPTSDIEPLAPLDFVQFDETRLPLMVIDEILGIALGRPWLAWLVDVYTGGIHGFYLGFEPPGDVVISSTLRHAFLFKSYVRDEYPDIAGDWLPSGMSRFVTFDNSLQAHGKTIETILNDLDVSWDYQPPRMPWLKSEVEGTFETINRLLIKELPGSVPNLGDGPHTKDYDPRQHARIGMRQLLWIFHHFVIDVLHERIPTTGRRIATNTLWREGIKNAPPGYIDQACDLDVLFGIVRKGRRLDHRGIFFEEIFYYGEGADVLRKQRGSVTYVTIKINPASLRRIYVLDEFDGGWYPLDAHPRDRAYASRVNLYTHRLYQSHGRRLYSRNDVEACLAAERDLQRIIRNVPQDALTIRNLSVLARSLGLGTHTLFDQLHHDGRLNVANGPYAGMPLLPLSPLAPVATSNTSPASSETTTARTRRAIPTFRADHSLS